MSDEEETSSKVISVAREVALRDVFIASEEAKKIIEKARLEAENMMRESHPRFIDVSRVPLICQSIIQINASLDELKENMVSKEAFWPVKTLVFGIVGLMLAGIVGALMVLVLK